MQAETRLLYTRNVRLSFEVVVAPPRGSLIVFLIGTSMLDLLDILFSRHGIQSLRFDGKMDRHARDTVLSTFKQQGGPKVILIRYARFLMSSAEC